MSRVRVAGFSISLDGYSAGPDQDVDNPLGVGAIEVLYWEFGTHTHRMFAGREGGTTGTDDDLVAQSFDNVGAWIVGRNMFGPVRGPWPDDSWRGWWGDDPIFHAPVFVLTNYAREPVVMEGGTTFYFVTDGIESALAQAKEAAGGKDVRVAGGVSTIRQYLQAGLVDDIHFAYSPVLIGSGERLFDGLNLKSLGYEVKSYLTSEKVTHVMLGRSGS